MNKKFKKYSEWSIAIWSRLVFSTAPSAFYQSDTGSWLSRDPFNEPLSKLLFTEATYGSSATVGMARGSEGPDDASGDLYGFLRNEPPDTT